MYNTTDLVYPEVNDSVRKPILVGLVGLLIFSLLGGYILSYSGIIVGAKLGHIIFLLFIFSETPILVNYFYFIISRIGLLADKILSFFTIYYILSLIFHSGMYTIVIGLTFAHIILVIQQSIYCLILIFILGILWTIDYILWFKSWPLYPGREDKTIFLYWFQWVVLFGLLIGLPFHARNWNLFWMSIFPTLTFGSLLLVIIQDIRIKRSLSHIRKMETHNPAT